MACGNNGPKIRGGWCVNVEVQQAHKQTNMKEASRDGLKAAWCYSS